MTGELAVEQFCRLLYRTRTADRLDVLMLADALEEAGQTNQALWLRRVPSSIRAYEVIESPYWSCGHYVGEDERESFPVESDWGVYYAAHGVLREKMHKILKRMEDSYGED